MIECVGPAPSERTDVDMSVEDPVLPDAGPVQWTDRHPDRVTSRYGVLDRLLAAGIDAARIQMYHDDEGDGCYWVITLDAGRMAVLTDDTEEHVSHIEGPWPFKVTFRDPGGIRTEIGDSIRALEAHVVTWYTQAAAQP
jgi:hypothetical protein